MAEQFPGQQARQLAEETGAGLMFYFVGLGPLIASPAALFLFLLVKWQREDPYDGRHRAALGLWSGFGLPYVYARFIAAAAREGVTDADHFLIRFRQRDLNIRMTLLAAMTVGVIATAAAVTLSETNTFMVAGPQGIVRQSAQDEIRREHLSLVNVLSVRTDCLQPRGKNRRWQAVFELHMKDGRTFDIGNGIPYSGGQLPALEAIATALPATTRYEPAEDLGGRINGCIAKAFADEPDAALRVGRLLRPTQVGTTPPP